MKEEIVYLDSSAIVKRYIEEPGSLEIRSVYRKAYAGEVVVSYSLWNVGEELEVFDHARRLERITEDDYYSVKRRFLNEIRRMLKLGIMIIVPVSFRILRGSWKILEKYHICVADALQIASAKSVNAKLFLTSDKKLYEIALKRRY